MPSWMWIRLVARLLPFCKILGISVRRRARSLYQTPSLERLEEINPASALSSAGPEVYYAAAAFAAFQESSPPPYLYCRSW